ncbi:MAG: GNAT family N-acetyltransferase [Candidatus Bipolaricaulota bacterium]|nr:GNAT family N-acetyltransferase [Candidatus Bipolaricaulota bacterium]
MSSKEASGQLRALDLRRDFDGLSKLIETAFAEDFQRVGVQFQQELRAVRRLVPWVLVLGRFSKFFREMLGGYAWEDQGRIVGSVMVQPQGLERRKWYISAVATHPDYRGRGIARRLMEAAIAHIRERNGELALLSVRADNIQAYRLYRSLGFVHFDSVTQLRLKPGMMPLFVSFERFDSTNRPSPAEIQVRMAQLAQEEIELSPGYRIRSMGLGEWRARYELAKQATPPEVQAFNPLSEREYRVALWMRLVEPLFDSLRRVRTFRWAAEIDGRVVGVLTLQAVRYSSMHQLRLTVHPEHEPVAEALLTQGLSLLQAYPGLGVLAAVRSSRAELLRLLQHYGFREVSTLHQMGLKLK